MKIEPSAMLSPVLFRIIRASSLPSLRQALRRTSRAETEEIRR